MGPARCSLLLGLAALLVACGSPSGNKPEGQGIPVVTTFLPITLLTRAVAGECATVQALVPPAVGPHDFQARPGDLLALQKARVLVTNGLGAETFLEPLIRAAANPQLRVIDSSRGVATLPGPAGPTGPHGADHDQDPNHGHAHGAVNPHIWLDPLRAAQQVDTIRAGLVAADPGCAAGYNRRAKATTAELQELHQHLARQLRPFRGKAFVAFHDVAPYFAERYGLKAVALVDVPEINPTPADLQRVTATVKANRIQALLSEPQAGEGSFQALAADLGVGLSSFDPLETGSEEASRNPASYVETMRRNGANLVKAFAGDGTSNGASQ
jgi:zinc transport system substrate-binding protein